MTQHWVDIKNADVVLLMGSNAAENHPMAFKWIQKAIDNGGTLINVDPRFCRSSKRAHIHAFMRSGTDIAFLGGMIKYAIDHGLYNEKYVKECTNALLKVRTDFETCAEGTLGIFSGHPTSGPWQTSPTWNNTLKAYVDGAYYKTTWDYNNSLIPEVANDLDDPDCVFQKLKKQFEDYTIPNVCAITGTDPDVYEQICQTYCGTYPDNKSGTIMYAMGITQHTVGTQNIRAYSILQLLLGNIGVAGGGINALRGQDNVQGSTDHCILSHILPGYLKVPTPTQVTLTDYNTANYNPAQAVNPVHSYTVRGVLGKDPSSAHWWKNGTKYIASLLKAWWPTIDHTTSYNYLSKKAATEDYSMLSMFDAMHHGDIKGAIFDGENPAVSDPDSNHVREALKHLDWLVCIDPFETETSAFWRLDPSGTDTVVYLLPAAIALEKYGSRSNSGRWSQWGWTNVDPPGYTTDLDSIPGGAKGDLEIITLLGQRIQAAYPGGGVAPNPILNLNWPCFNYLAGDDRDTKAEKVAKEINGYSLTGTTLPTTTLVASFSSLTDTGTTASGNWLYCNSFVEVGSLDAFETGTMGMTSGNRMKRRYSPDVCKGGPTADPLYATNKIGLHWYWSWCWPVNRRIIYNRASTYQSDVGTWPTPPSAGDPLAPNKYVIRYDGSTFVGDQIDGGASAVGDMYPFIMQKDGHGHLFGGWTVAEGPFPWHYEPAESPIDYPAWLGSYRMNPIVHVYPGALFATHGGTEYKICATTYRLTEHWHTGSMSRNLPRLYQLQPEPFVEMSEELASGTTSAYTGPAIHNGDLVRVTSARGYITVKACVTKRFRPFQLNGKTVHQVGVIWHWGYMGLCKGDSGNILTPFIGDANTRIQESKAFRVKIEKV
jgi:formate dehydrogenase major subunit